jgi:hypothetical protein
MNKYLIVKTFTTLVEADTEEQAFEEAEHCSADTVEVEARQITEPKE